MKRRFLRGITTVEVVVAVLLVGIIAGCAVQLLASSMRTTAAGEKEYDLQTGMKYTAEEITQRVRYSTAVFIIPESSFWGSGTRSPGWNYLGIEETAVDGTPATQIVRYTWVADSTFPVGGYHNKEILVEPRRDMVYDLTFSSDFGNYGENAALYTLKAGDTYWDINTAVEALNSLQLVDYGTASNPGRAIAYRGDARDVGGTTVTLAGRVAMVIDDSNSMKWSFAGSMLENNERLNAMKDAAHRLIDMFAAAGNPIEVGIIPFETHANPRLFGGVNTFFNAADPLQKPTLDNAINSLTANWSNPRGGTNTGDGIRRAYWALKNAADASSEAVPHYVVILVDGETNMLTATSNVNTVVTENKDVMGSSNNTYVYSSQIVGGYSIIGTSIITEARAQQYVTTMGNVLTNEFSSNANVASSKCYLVGVSSSVTTTGLNNIKAALNIADTDVFRAEDTAQLTAAFETIGQSIIDDIWAVMGPDL